MTGRQSSADPGTRRTTATARTWAFSAFLALSTLGLYAAFAAHVRLPKGPFELPWWALAAMFCLAEILVVHMHLRSDAYAFSLSEIPLVIGLFTATPGALVLGQVVGSAVALAGHRRQAPAKLAFNLGHFAMETTLAVIVFGFASVSGPLSPLAWATTMATCLLVALVADVTVGVGMSLAEGDTSVLPRITSGLLFGKIASLGNAALGLLGAVILWTEPRAAWLLLVPAAALFLAYAGYLSQRKRRERLQFLYESTRLFGPDANLENALLDLLARTREAFRADIAEITLRPLGDGQTATRTAVGPGDAREARHPARPDPSLWKAVVVADRSVLLRRPIRSGGPGDSLRAWAIRDAVIAPLHAGGDVVGMMTVANRLGTVDTFDWEDLHLLEALANEAGAGQSLLRLAELNELKDDFLATVSHELRTPLTSVVGCAKTLRQTGVELDPPTRESLLEVIDRQSGRLGLLVDDLLIASRLGSAPLRAVAAPIALDALVGQVIEDFRSRIPTHQFVLRAEGRIPVVPTDDRKVRHIVSNFLDNARKYAPPSTAITVEVACSGSGVRVAVEDQGMGVPPELREKIFERFYQAHEGSAQAGGVGLGLFICRQLASAVGGRVWVEASGPNGSVFALWIPMVPPEGAYRPPRLQDPAALTDLPVAAIETS
jgi:signal transduction histidine kinase